MFAIEVVLILRIVRHLHLRVVRIWQEGAGFVGQRHVRDGTLIIKGDSRRVERMIRCGGRVRWLLMKEQWRVSVSVRVRQLMNYSRLGLVRA